MLTLSCTCGETYHADEQHAGGRIRCKCGRLLEIVANPKPADLIESQERFVQPSRESSDVSTDMYLRRGAMFKFRRWVIGGSIVGILMLCGGVYRIANPSEGRKSTGTLAHAPAQMPTSGTTVQPVLPPCPPDAHVRPTSGTELGGKHRGGLGRLQVANGTDSDAVAVLMTMRQKRHVGRSSFEAGNQAPLLPCLRGATVSVSN